MSAFVHFSGSAGRGQRRPEHHPGGGERIEGQCQRPGPDAVPGGGTAIPVSSLETTTDHVRQRTMSAHKHSYLFIFCLYCQNAPAPCSPAVPGPVLRGHSLSAGHGVLPSGETRLMLFCAKVKQKA